MIDTEQATHPRAPAGPTAPRVAPSAFSSFWMAGFEGADHIDLHGTPLDMVASTGHAVLLAAEYQRVADLGLTTVRESVGWRVCSPDSFKRINFSRMQLAAEAAMTHGVQVLWSLIHYGMPPDVRVTDIDFADRFAEFAGAAARKLRNLTGAPSIYNPVNEIGFLAWAMASQRIIGGLCSERDGYVVKVKLVQAALRGMQAISAEDSGARFTHVEPLIHVVSPRKNPALAQAAADFCGYQWEVWDMLAGRMAPELGGSVAQMDWIGVNHYHDSQWEIETGRRLDWHRGDSRRRPFANLLEEASKRYQLPIVIAETSHVGVGRAAWLDDIGTETEHAIGRGARVQGICLYPAIDRPDWNNHSHCHRSGLWDAVASRRTGASRHAHHGRRLTSEYAAALRRWQLRLGGLR
jgi:beta-glucosidase/6-phospho-beta-glucosidase/beta-galactosidase